MYGTASRHASARSRELHTVDRPDDVVDRIEQRRILGEDSIDEWPAPGLDEHLWLKTAADPCSSNSTNSRIDGRIAALDGDRCHGGRVEPACGEGIGDHGISIVKRLLCDSRVVHGCPSRLRMSRTYRVPRPGSGMVGRDGAGQQSRAQTSGRMASWPSASGSAPERRSSMRSMMPAMN